MKNITFLVIALFSLLSSFAQQIETHSNREMIFAFEVKQIDEFFERFNNSAGSFFAAYLQNHFPGILPDRLALLKSLFDLKKIPGSAELAEEFCLQVSDTVNPSYLDFYSHEWYAEAICKFTLNGRPIEITLLLKIERTANGGSKWMIAGVHSRDMVPAVIKIGFPEKSTCCKFLNPMSHATNFISLSRALGDKTNLPDYLDSNFLHHPYSAAFTQALLRNQLQYHYVREIRYHFLQVEGWVFTVSQYRRQSIHSGWLISNLKKATATEKEQFKHTLFHKSNTK